MDISAMNSPTDLILDDDDLPTSPPPEEENEEFFDEDPPSDLDDKELLFDGEEDFDDSELLSLPSMHSDDDQWYCDEDDLDDPEFDEQYGDLIDELSNPDDYLPHLPPEWDEDCDPDDDPSPEVTNPPTLDTQTETNMTNDSDVISPPIARRKRAPILITSSSDSIALCDHVIFGKYFKMMRASGLPKDMVRLKIFQDGLNPDILDCDEFSVLPVGFPIYAPATIIIPAHYHNSHNSSIKLFASVDDDTDKSGVNEIEGGGGDKRARRAIPLPPPHFKHHLQPPPPLPTATDQTDQQNNTGGGDEELVAAKDHPIYSRYFLMLKVGLPRANIEQKMIIENLDPDYLFTLTPTTMINKHYIQRLSAVKQAAVKVDVKSKLAPTPSSNPKSRKKRVFITAIDHTQIGEDSLWRNNDKDDDEDTAIVFDEKEFNRLFVDDADQDTLSKSTQNNNNNDISKKRTILKTIINPKRAQNGAIALSRIKFKPSEIIGFIYQLSVEALTSDQLKACLEFLPTAEETKLINSYPEDRKGELGVVEQYMLATLDLANIKLYIDTILFKQLFLSRWHDVKHRLGLLESACDQIKQSRRLKIVLRTVLKVVNQLNSREEGSEQAKAAGITVESLLNLFTTKAFDRKTSVLQYVIIIIEKHHHNNSSNDDTTNSDHPLLFPSDLPLLSEAAKMTIESVSHERQAIESELKSLITSLKTALLTNDSNELAQAAQDFEYKLLPLCNDLDKRQQQLQGKFSNILSYFGERPSLSWPEFFQPLHRFVLEFTATWQQVEKAHQVEKRKAHAIQRLQLQQQQQMAKQHTAVAATGGGGGRRSSVAAAGRRASVVKKSSVAGKES